MHVNGVDNKVADCLSHYYENDTSDNTHLDNTYVNTDIRLDPDGELLLTDHYMELCAAAMRQSKCLAERQESCHIKAKILNTGDKELLPSEITSPSDDVVEAYAYMHKVNPNIFLHFLFILYVYHYPFTVRTSFQFFLKFSLFFFPLYSH